MKNKFLYISLLFAIALASCYTPRYVYSPTASMAPMVTQKGDGSLAAVYSSNPEGDRTVNNRKIDGYARGVDVNGAYAFKKNWLAQASYSYRSELNHGNSSYIYIDSAVVRYKRNMTELIGGYYHTQDKMVLQMLGGVGVGKLSFTDNGNVNGVTNYSRKFQSGIVKVFVQPSLQFYFSDTYFSTSLVSRISWTKFTNIKTNYDSTEQVNYLLDAVGKHNYLFWEPSVSLQAGLKKMKALRIHGQIGFASLLTNRFIDYRSLYSSVGIVYLLRPKSK